MRAHDEFTIPYLGLPNGPHLYLFDLENSFFTAIEKSIVENGKMACEITFDKQDRTIVLFIDCSGYFLANCDRCLAPIQVPVKFSDKLIIKIEEEPDKKFDEVYYLAPNTSHIDLGPYIMESIHLYLPMKNIRNCEDEQFKFCDKEVLKNLERNPTKTEPPMRENPWGALDKLNLE